ncbi:hypothetical protein vseg_017003 [Gypsophila vaccaria]
MVRLRSSSLKSEDSRVDLGRSDGNSRVVNIPDLNLNDEQDGVSVEEGGSKTVGEPSSSMCDGGVRVGECKGLEVENEGRVEGSMGNGDIGLKDSMVVEKLNDAVDLADTELRLDADAMEDGVDVKKSVEDDKTKMVCQNEEKGNVRSPCVDGDEVGGIDDKKVVSVVSSEDGEHGNDDRRMKDCDSNLVTPLESGSAEVKESSENRSAVDDTEGDGDEADESGKVKKKPKEGKIQVLGKVLRSRFVPGNGLGEEVGGRQIGVSPNKRKRDTDDSGNILVTMKDEASKLSNDSKMLRRSGRSKRSIDLPKEEVAELNNVKQESKGVDEGENDVSVRSSQKRKKRGRPKKLTDHPKDQSVHVHQPMSLSGTEDEDVDDRSMLNTKDQRREELIQSCSKEDSAVDCRAESKAGKFSKKSVGSATPMRKSERSKRVVDYCEKEVVQRRRFSGGKLIYETEEESEGVVSNIIVPSSIKKTKRGRPKKNEGNRPVRKRGRPRKNEGNSPVKMLSDDNGTNDGEKLKASSTTTIGRRRLEIDHHGTATDRVPMVEEKSSKEEKTSDELQVLASSESKEALPADTKLTDTLSKREIAESRAAEKNAIRNQIVDMLRHAGWTIEYRPRNGREYNDAVYVNPGGMTHWSITKAYSALLKEVEKRKTGSAAANSSISFTPLPDEALSKLFRVVSKTRSDKNKKKKHKRDGDSSDQDLTKGGKGSKTGAKRKHPALKRKASARDGTQSKRRCALVARRSKGLNLESVEAISYSGKHSILAWLIDSGSVSRDGKVLYMNRRKTKTMLEGSITRDGISCHCCKEVFSVLEFEKHAGIKPGQLYENLFLESGQSLLRCLLESWNKQDAASLKDFHTVNVDADDPNDDTCAICGDGGDLMCCDGCPSTFHSDCMNLEEVPSGEWHCVYCSCKFCGESENDTDTTDSLDTAYSSLVTCSLCNQKYHPSCSGEENIADVKSESASFCGENCEQIFENLQTLIGAKSDLGDGFSWTILQRFDVKAESDSSEAQKIESNSKLAVALSVMDECFVPIIDPRSGFNVIRHVVYNSGSNFSRLNFRSFFTIILEKGDEIISAASVRIHGKQMAEMPFIGTRNIYRRQGMCRRLLTAIELALSSLDVENLVIPAIPELLDTWTSVFGFQPLEESIREEMRSTNIMVFAHTDMLQKPLPEHHLVDEGVSPTVKDGNCLKSSTKQLHSGAEKSEVDNVCFQGSFDLNVEAPGIPESSSDDTDKVDDLPTLKDISNSEKTCDKVEDQPTPSEISNNKTCDKVEDLPIPMEISDNKTYDGCLNLNHPETSSDDKPLNMELDGNMSTQVDPGKAEDGLSQPNRSAITTSDNPDSETVINGDMCTEEKHGPESEVLEPSLPNSHPAVVVSSNGSLVTVPGCFEQVSSESSCNTGSAVAENTTTALFLAAGAPKVGS